MTTGSLEFLGILLISTALFPFIPTVQLRQVFVALVSAGCLWTQIPHWGSWLALAAFVLSGYGVAQMLRRGARQIIFWSYLAVLTAAFLILKKYTFLYYFSPRPLLSHSLGIIGLSYILFRQIHVLVDSMQGQTPSLKFWDYCNYQLNVFTLTAGPIQRFQDFLNSWNTLTPLPAGLYEVLKTWLRILTGVVKTAGIGPALLYVYGKSYTRIMELGPRDPTLSAVLPWFAAMFYLYPLYIYVNFSGYCDIVIGGAALMGIAVPENFNKPYLSRNVIDFWTRFHRTLGFWIRDYLFMPFHKAMATRNPARAQSLAFVSYFFAFVIAGVWHGSTSNFAVYGLIHGFGASTTKIWETYLIKTRGRAYLKRYLEINWIRSLAIVVTLHFYAFSILFFSGTLEKCMAPVLVLTRTLGWNR